MGDSSVSCGVSGGHSVVSWQPVDLEDTRWFIHMSGTLAGMSGRLDSAGTVHQSTSVPASPDGGPRQWDFLYGAQASKRHKRP